MRLAGFLFFLFCFHFLIGIEAKASVFNSTDQPQQVSQVEYQAKDQIHSAGSTRNHDYFPNIWVPAAKAPQFFTFLTVTNYSLSVRVLLGARFYFIKSGLSPPLISLRS
ncbi:MAG: hypothetical protein ACXWRZ_08525 [Bdellovibrio sp.]